MSELTGRNLKAFIGAKEYETSLAFYRALGFAVNWDGGDLAELQIDGCKFFLQNYYERAWCDNLMMHMEVGDANAWYARIVAALDKGSFGDAKTKPPVDESYGALVTYIWDPSGVLWHMAQLKKPS